VHSERISPQNVGEISCITDFIKGRKKGGRGGGSTKSGPSLSKGFHFKLEEKKKKAGRMLPEKKGGGGKKECVQFPCALGGSNRSAHWTKGRGKTTALRDSMKKKKENGQHSEGKRESL